MKMDVVTPLQVIAIVTEKKSNGTIDYLRWCIAGLED